MPITARSILTLTYWQSRIVGDLLALIGGALLPLAFAPFHLWPLAILLLSLLLWLWQGESPARAGWRGGLFGVGAYATGISWVYVSLHDYGNAPAVFAVLATSALVLLMALYPAVVGYLLARWAPSPGPARWLLVAPALWAGLEWVRSWLFSGFPWLALGYSQIDGSLAGLAPYVGVFGVSWAVMLSAGLILLMVWGNLQARLTGCVLAGLVWGIAWGLGQLSWAKPDGEPLHVSLVQGNVSQDQKWRPQQLKATLRLYTELSLSVSTKSDIIIWPETAIPVFYRQVEDFIQTLEAEAQRSGTDYLIGIPSGDWETGVFHNSVISLGSSHGFYRKHRLLPFGEYLPLRFLLNFFHRFVDIPMADFTPGSADQALLRAATHPIGTSICFEAAFGSEIRLSLPQARLLVNVSNDAWFGNSLAPHQHLQIARMRAREAERFLARATNTGITAIIDPYGEVIAVGNQFKQEVLQGRLQPMSGATPYVLMGDGLTVVLLGIALTLGLVLEWAVDGRRWIFAPAALGKGDRIDSSAHRGDK